MMDILRDLTPLNRVFCSSDYDKSIQYLKNILPFKVHSYSSKDIHNGWVIPPKWDVKEAKIYYDGEMIYDGLEHALRVISLSRSFHGSVDLNELKRHLYFDHRYEDATPYHFRQMYRSWSRDWGFCVTKIFFDGLRPGKYDVVIETEESEGTLKVIEYVHHGAQEETFAFAGHLDHPGMANDDLAGCAVGVELFRRLLGRNTKYTYILLLVQEIIGSEYYWGRTNMNNPKKIREALWLEMLGTKTQLALQHSVHANSNMEFAVLKSLKELGLSHRTGPFKSIVYNDEYVWEAYGVPMASLSRAPYPEYHTDRDNFSLMSQDALTESLDVALKTIEHLESTKMVYRKFTGNICLSNPEYDLYVDAGRPEFGNWADEQVQKLRLLMDMIPMLRQPTTIESLARIIGLDEKKIEPYLEMWRHKNLIDIK